MLNFINKLSTKQMHQHQQLYCYVQ